MTVRVIYMIGGTCIKMFRYFAFIDVTLIKYPCNFTCFFFFNLVSKDLNRHYWDKLTALLGALPAVRLLQRDNEDQ